MKILLVEDNKQISENIRKYLELEWYEVHPEYDGQAGLDKALEDEFDLIILDIMMPKMDGMEVCQNIRKRKEVPIIMATAKGEIEDKLDGFDYGADDYIVKPFDMNELVARIKAILKRKNKFSAFVFENIKILLDKKQAFKDNKEVKLTLKEFQILEYLMANYNMDVSRADIIEDVWWGNALFERDDKLDVYISNIRRKLDKKLITTIKGFGYKIEKS